MIKKMKRWLNVIPLAALALAVMSCVVDGSGGAENEKRSSVKLNKNGTRVIHTVWYEPEEDPRQVIGYQLQDGTAYFDHVNMLYGMRLRNRDCPTLSPGGRCQLTGLHACIRGNMGVYVDESEVYFKPIQDSGIKVLLSLVPEEDGVCVGTLYNWPLEAQYPWNEISGGREYPYGEEATARLIQQIADLFNDHQIDGIGYDEEYAGTINVNINNRPQELPVYGGTDGENLLRFAYELQKACGRDIIQEAYNIRTAENLPESIEIESDGEIITVYRDEIIDYSFDENYGGWAPKRTWSDEQRAKYGPASVGIADVPNKAPQPAYGRSGGSGILARMEDHLKDNYGVVMYYCLRSRDELKYGIPEWGIAPWPTKLFAENDQNPETYFSEISMTLHGQKTVYVGPDYPRRFQTQ